MGKGTKIALMIAVSVALSTNLGAETNTTYTSAINPEAAVEETQDVSQPGPNIGTDTPEEMYTGTTTLFFNLKKKSLRPKKVALLPGSNYSIRRKGTNCKLYSVKKQKTVAEVTIACLSYHPDNVFVDVMGTYSKKPDKEGVVDSMSEPLPAPVTDTWKYTERHKHRRFSELRQTTEHLVVLQPTYNPETKPDVDYAFLSYQLDRQTPVAWKTCEGPVSVHVHTNENMPDVFFELVNRVLKDVGEYSGVDLQMAGSTTFEPQRGLDDDPTVESDLNITIATVDRNTNSFFTQGRGLEHPNAIGWGGSQLRRGKDRQLFYINGITVLDKDWIKDHLAQGGSGYVYAVLAHELGHVMGLGHVEDRFEVMYPVASFPTKSLQKGDKKGLTVLKNSSCNSPQIS